MSVGQNSADRVVELVTLLAMASKVLTELTERLQTARADQISALANDTKMAVEQIVSCCADTASLDHLPSESVEALHADLVRMGQAEIAGIIKLRWAQLESGGAFRTRH